MPLLIRLRITVSSRSRSPITGGSDGAVRLSSPTERADTRSPAIATHERTTQLISTGLRVETVPREGLWESQTPQVFARQLLLDAHARRGDFQATDDAQLVERIGHPVTVVVGSTINLKIATREDLRLAEQALKALPKPKLAGPGHPFAGDDMWR